MTWWARVEDPRTRRARSWVIDVFCVLAVAVLTLPSAVAPTRDATGSAVVGYVLVIVVLLVRRIWPLPVFAFQMVVLAGLGYWIFPDISAPAVIVALYTVASASPRRVSLWCAGSIPVAAVVAGFLVRLPGTPWWTYLVASVPFVIAAVGSGLYVRTRRVLLAELRDRAVRLEHERDQQGALAAAAERARIAREMHDVVAHHLTVMVALSDGAAAALARSPERAAEAMRTVSATGRQALTDTRRLLGVLRDDGPGEADRRPLPDLRDLDALLERVRGAGLPVRYEVHGAPPDVPSGVQLTVFRLVQEALTNTIKHGGSDATAVVRMHYSAERLRVDVEDDGDVEAAAASGVGRGLLGMRERVTAFGGDVVAGPRPGRGWRVSATLRLDAAS